MLNFLSSVPIQSCLACIVEPFFFAKNEKNSAFSGIEQQRNFDTLKQICRVIFVELQYLMLLRCDQGFFRALIEDRPEGRGRYFGWLKKILLYNPLFDREDFLFGFGHQRFFDVRCPVANCYLTNNRTLLGRNHIKSKKGQLGKLLKIAF